MRRRVKYRRIWHNSIQLDCGSAEYRRYDTLTRRFSIRVTQKKGAVMPYPPLSVIICAGPLWRSGLFYPTLYPLSTPGFFQPARYLQRRPSARCCGGSTGGCRAHDPRPGSARRSIIVRIAGRGAVLAPAMRAMIRPRDPWASMPSLRAGKTRPYAQRCHGCHDAVIGLLMLARPPHSQHCTRLANMLLDR